jgi:phospholipase/carboxylesterase
MTTYSTPLAPSGLHHITGITGDPQANVDFYVGVLGLRLVKKTVNHSDPSTLHLFYGDAEGRPGTLLTFFAWPGAAAGRRGHGGAAEVGLLIPRASVGAWTQHLLRRGVPFEGPTPAGESSRLALRDPDGLPLVLVGVSGAPAGRPWAGPSLPAEMQVRGLHHVTLWTERLAETGRVLTAHLGFRFEGGEGTTHTYRAPQPEAPQPEGVADLGHTDLGHTDLGHTDLGHTDLGHTVYVRDVSGFWSSADGAGAVHHVAFRAAGRDLKRLRAALQADGLGVSETREHGYFRSLYVREPGGVLVEVATETPGMTLDEDPARLGERLVLPPALEPQRPDLEVTLPAIVLPGGERRVTRDLGWIHRFVSGEGDLTLLLLHGTGGDETQLLSLGRAVLPTANLLGVRGRSLEEGAPRFFRRYTPTRYDQAHLKAEADALAQFVREAADLYDLDPARVVALGYSNGANIALASLVRHPGVYAGAALLRPVMALEDPPPADLKGRAVLVLHGARDGFLPFAEPVAPYLRAQGAAVQEMRLEAGHALTPEDTALIEGWLRRF